ncbi:hypothetical protein X548_03035 [Stenotrophomonas maltophilia 5BA-I-2]|nr:hypothetical protein X548_03035 [Stenotrophomonas maltophilia 5BA-I-2]
MCRKVAARWAAAFAFFPGHAGERRLVQQET